MSSLRHSASITSVPAQTAASRFLVQSGLKTATAAATPAPSTSLSGANANNRQLSRSASHSALSTFKSKVEQDVINARTPLRLNSKVQREEVQVGPYRGVQLNKEEEDQFKGPLPLSRYQLNNDPNPEIIKKPSDRVQYKQNIHIRYLKPPTPSPHGPLIIRERPTKLPPPPPLVLRVQGKQAPTPAPLVIREQPPRPPTRQPTRVLEVDAAPSETPARRVVVEKLSDEPEKPQSVLLERWLPYKSRARRVIYERQSRQNSCGASGEQRKPSKHVVIEWESKTDQECPCNAQRSASASSCVRNRSRRLRIEGDVDSLAKLSQLNLNKLLSQENQE